LVDIIANLTKKGHYFIFDKIVNCKIIKKIIWYTVY